MTAPCQRVTLAAKQKPSASHPAAPPAGSCGQGPGGAGRVVSRLFSSKGGSPISRDLRVNHEIRAREVRLIDEDGTQLGVLPIRDALRIAMDKGLDLVEVAPTAQPVVCRVMDYGRFKYETAKREREARTRQHVTLIKELKLRPNIGDHDFEVKLRNAERFLRDGDKVKLTIMFRGRQIVHPQLGREVLNRMAEALRPMSVIESEPRIEGRNMSMLIAPKPSAIEREREKERQKAPS